MRAMLLAILILLPLASQAQQWCWDGDEFVIEVLDGKVIIQHKADLINCCPDPITWDIAVGDATTFIQENWASPCDCDCCYDLQVTLADVGPGPWILRYSWYDIESGGWVDEEFFIEMPDAGQGYETYVYDQDESGCLEATSVPEPMDRSWSTVKTLY